MLYVGIDPGVTGAVSVIDCTYLQSGEIECHDTPVYHDGKRARINPADCAALLRDLKRDSGGKLAIFIEKSQPMPKNGSIACFGLGYSFGVWLGILAALEIPHTVVTPQRWKAAMMPGEPKEKDASRVVARRLWPAQTEEWLSRKRDHGRADALLIAEYGRRTAARAYRAADPSKGNFIGNIGVEEAIAGIRAVESSGPTEIDTQCAAAKPEAPDAR